MFSTRCVALLACALAASNAYGQAAPDFPGNDHSRQPSVTADGRYVVFSSRASNLVRGDTNGTDDIFLLDRGPAGKERRLTRISTNAAGAQSDGQSWSPSIAANGRYVAFASNATNLVAGDTNDAADVFRKDLQTGAIVRVTVGDNGQQGSDATEGFDTVYTTSVTISADGRYVAFNSPLTGLIARVNGSCIPAAFVRDMATATLYTTQDPDAFTCNFVSAPVVAAVPCPPLTICGEPVFPRLAFRSREAWVPADTNGLFDVYIATLEFSPIFPPPPPAFSYRLVSAGGGSGGNGHSGGVVGSQYGPSISSDGSRVAFPSLASDLAAGDANGSADIFVFDTGQGQTTRETNGVGPVGHPPALSPDGQFLAYRDELQDRWYYKPVPGGTPVELGPGAPLGSAFEDLGHPAISDGATLAAWPAHTFDPPGTRLDTREDVIVSTGGGAARTMLLASAAQVGTALDGHSRVAAISADGRSVAFSSYASGFGGNDPGGNRDVFLRLVETGATTRLTALVPGLDARADSRWPDLSGDGTRAVFLSSVGGATCPEGSGAIAVVPGGVPEVRCLDADGSGLANVAATPFQQPAISNDGVWAAFAGTDAAAPNPQLYLRNLDSGVLLRASRTGTGAPIAGSVAGYAQMTFDLSGDGRHAVYSHFDGSAIRSPSEGCHLDIGVSTFDRTTGETLLVSRYNAGGAPGQGAWASISADGRFIAFISCDDLAGDGGGNTLQRVFVWDRSTQQVTRVRTESLGRRASAIKARTRLSADGRVLAFLADDKCVALCATRERAIVVHDRVTRALRIASTTSAWSRANGPSGTEDDFGFNTFQYALDLSADGRKVVFSSAATNLAPGDTNAADDVYLVDLETQAATRISDFGTGLPGDLDRLAPSLSANGAVVAYAVKDRVGATAKALGRPGAKGIGDKWGDVAIDPPGPEGERIVSVTPAGGAANGDSGEPDVATDGSVVAYSTFATDLTPGADTNDATDIIVYDVALDANTSVTTGGNGPSSSPAATNDSGSGIGDKWHCAYTTDATNLQNAGNMVPDVNGASDVLVSIEPASPGGAPVTELVSRADGAAGALGNGPSGEADVMPGGGAVVFSSLASNLKPADTNNASDIFLRDYDADTTIAISVPDGGGEANGPSSDASIARPSPGTWLVAYETDATNLVANDLNASTDVLLRSSSGTTTLVSHAFGQPGVPANGTSSSPKLSSDGLSILFVSSAENLIANDNNGIPDLFVYNTVTGNIVRISQGAAALDSDDLSVSGDVATGAGGNPISVFDSAATNLGDEPDFERAFDVYYIDANGNYVPIGPADILFRSGFEDVQIE